ncbi:STAS domain-containing protein [Cobetia amphilecti]|uniref:STAS domain-containing protein n=1 Tax=Cobetia amphilecti TaxID=1055104 RepID=UPI000694A6AE|nr:STAS domain-containing protein [Cobetia amphilecti]
MTMKTLFDREGVTLQAGDARLSLSGQPDFDNAAELADSGRKWLGRREDGVSIDLCGVDSASTATLSVLLEWQRHLAEHGGHVAHLALSPALSRLAAVSGLENLLPGLNVAEISAEPPLSLETP